MSKKQDGGPAYPVKHRGQRTTDSHIEYVYTGMSLRDYFAAKAMAVLLDRYLTNSQGHKGTKEFFTKLNELASEDAYELADAMLAERSKEES